MKVSKKLLIMAVLFLTSFLLVACGETTTVATTAAPTTAATTTVAPTTEAPTTTAAPVDLPALMTELKTHYADTLENESYLAEADLTLLETIGDVAITWVSANATYLENDGTIHRPSFDLGDQTVILSATMVDGEETESYNFFVTVKALDKSDQERANEVFLVATAFPSKELWTSADNDELDFVVTGKDADDVDYTIVWTSSHPDVISVDGEITQPLDADVDVTMTATITIDSVDYTEDVVFSVAKMLEGTEVATIAAAIALGEEAYVKIMGVTVIAVNEMGDVYFTDGTDILYIYSASFDPIVGNVYDITGEVDFYYNAPQLKGSDVHPLRAEDSMALVSAAPITAAVAITDIISGLTTPTPENMFAYEIYEVTAKVYYEEDWGNYSVFLVPTDYDFGAALSSSTQPNGDSIMIYYKSNMETLAPFHDGKEITIQIITQGWRSDKMVWYGNFFGEVTDIQMTFADDAEAVSTALAAFDLPEEVKEATTLDLMSELYGVTLTYTSDDEAVINSTTGVVDLTGLVSRQLVTITVTATKGTDTDTKVIEIQVGELPLLTIAEALALADDDSVKIQGIVIGSEYYNTFLIQDATGGIAVYTYDSDTKDFLEANIGNLVEIIGARASYKGLLQIKPETATFVEESVLPTPMNLDAVAEADLYDYHGMLVEFTDLYVDDVYADSYGNVTVTFIRLSDSTEIEMKWDSRVSLSAAAELAVNSIAVGDKVSVIAGLGWYNDARLFYADDTTIIEGTPYTDAELLAVDAAMFPAELTLSADYDLPELLFSTATVAISAELQANLTDDILTNSQIDVLVPGVDDLTGIVTFTLTLNAETTNVVINVVIEAFTEADKLAADLVELIAGAAEVEAMEYQTFELPIMGTYGSVITWTLVSGTATINVNEIYLDPTGVSHDVVVEATLTLGSETPVVQQFTLTVAPVTLVTDFATLHDNTAGVFTIADDTEVYVSGVVIGFGYHVVYIQDANGEGLYAYYGEGHENDGTINIGDEVIYYGLLDSYNGIRRLGDGAELHAVISMSNAIIDFDYTLDEVNALAIEDTGKIISVTGLVYTGMNYGKLQFDVIGTSTMTLELYPTSAPDWFLDVFAVSDVLPEVTFMYKETAYGNLFVEIFEIVMTDQMMLDADVNAIPATMDVTEDYVILTGAYGSTIAVTGITGDAATYLDFATTPGTILFTEPLTDMVGVITLEVTQGLLPAEVVTIDVTVKAAVVTGEITELFISEYIEGSGSNKAIEIYNGTGADVDLSTYRIDAYNNGAELVDGATNSYDFTGTLAAGDVFVIYNSGASVAEILSEGDDTSTVTYYNGEDCIILYNGDTIIDSIGQIGVDPGSSWTTGDVSTGEMTLVRDSSITGGDTDITDAYDPSIEWTAYPQDTGTYIGSHIVD